MKYYKYVGAERGLRFFKVKNIDTNVVQIIVNSGRMKGGRTNTIGICFIRYSSFSGNWAWRLKDSKYIIEIAKSEYDEQFDQMTKKLKHG